MSTNTVTIYTKVYCPYCVRAKALLSQKGVEFLEHKIDEQPELRPQMVELAGGRTTVPQIFINGQHVGGCDDLYALEAKGQLDQLLQR